MLLMVGNCMQPRRLRYVMRSATNGADSQSRLVPFDATATLDDETSGIAALNTINPAFLENAENGAFETGSFHHLANEWSIFDSIFDPLERWTAA